MRNPLAKAEPSEPDAAGSSAREVPAKQADPSDAEPVKVPPDTTPGPAPSGSQCVVADCDRDPTIGNLCDAHYGTHRGLYVPDPAP